MKSPNLVLLLLLLNLSVAVAADPEVGRSPMPEWADEIPLEPFPEDRSGQVRQGLAYLLSDRQYTKTELGYDFVVRVAYQIVDRSGLEEAATITHIFDPEFNTAAFNHVRLIREGEEAERLDDVEISILRQESGLSQNVLDGDYTALIQLNDVRVGDIIDYAYSGTVATPLWPNDFFITASVEWSVPIALARFRLSVPAQMEVSTLSLATDIEAEVSTVGDRTQYELAIRNPDPVAAESATPGNWISHGLVAVSTMQTWTDVADWAVPIFTFDQDLPDEFAAKLDRIAADYSNDGERATRALRLVQNEIRYLGLELGLGSHVPRPPAMTLERGYGDCKDKSVLLVSALEYLGIKAYPALASTISGELTAQMLPSIGSFNHAIVGVELGDRTLWVDPTLSYQGGVGNSMAPLSYGQVLPVRQGQSGLVEIEVPIPRQPTYEVDETIEHTEEGGLTLIAEHRFRDAEADSVRVWVADVGNEAVARYMADYYVDQYPDLKERKPTLVTDDLDANSLIIRAEFSMGKIPFEVANYDDVIPLFVNAVQNVLPSSVEADRRAPLAMPFGYSNRHVIRVTTPGHQLDVPEETFLSAGGATYLRRFLSSPGEIEVEAALVVTERVAPRSAIRSVIALADTIAESAELTLTMPEPEPGPARSLGFEAPLDGVTESALSEIEKLLANASHVQALVRINSLLSQQEAGTEFAGFLNQLKGTALKRLGRRRAALEAFRKGFEWYEPASSEPYFLYSDLLFESQRFADSASNVKRMLGKYPDSIAQLRNEPLRELSRQLLTNSDMEARDSLLAAVADGLTRVDARKIDEFRWVFPEAVRYLSSNGREAEAIRYLEHIVSPADIGELLVNREFQGIWKNIEDQAGSDLSLAIERNVRFSEERLEDEPDDLSRKQQYLRALRIARRFDDALEYGESVVSDWGLIEAVGRDAFFFVNQYAYVLSEAGKPLEADALFARLLELGVYENEVLMNMAINRAIVAMDWGRHEQALQLVGDIEALPEDMANSFGWMFAYGVKACSLHRLGDAGAATRILDNDIMPIASMNPPAHMKALLCLERFDDAADLLVSRLRDEEDRAKAVEVLIDPIHSEEAPTFAIELRQRLQKVMDEPAVRQELDKVGRPLLVKGTAAFWADY